MGTTLLLGTLLACKGGDLAPQGTDLRVDHAPKGVDSQGLVACMPDDKVIYLAWYDDREGEDAIWFNRSLDGGQSWMPSDRRLNNPDPEVGGAARNPTIACAGERVYVAWEDERDGELDNANIYFNASSDRGDSWAAEDRNIDVDPDGANISLDPAIATDGSGRLVVAWSDSRNGAYDILVSVSDDHGQSWSQEPVRVDTDPAGEAWSARPVIAMEGDTVVVAWEDLRSGVSDIYLNVSTTGGSSFAATDLQVDRGKPADADSFSPVLLLSEGYGYIAWHTARPETNADVWLNRSENGGQAWMAEAVRLETRPAEENDARFPALAAAGPDLHVAWQDDRNGGFDIFYNHSTDGGASWVLEEEYRMDRDAAGSAQSYDPMVALDGTDVAVIWKDRRYDQEALGFNDLFYTFSDDGGEGWSASDHRINGSLEGTAYALEPWVALRGGTIYAAWVDGRSGSADIYFTALPLGDDAVYAPPTEDAAR